MEKNQDTYKFEIIKTCCPKKDNEIKELEVQLQEKEKASQELKKENQNKDEIISNLKSEQAEMEKTMDKSFVLIIQLKEQVQQLKIDNQALKEKMESINTQIETLPKK